MNNPPKNHHFVPEFYQKGFASDEGKLYAYTKQYGSIKERTPAQILYKKHLHTIALGKENMVAIETFYSSIEGEFAKYRKLIQENLKNPDIIKSLKENPNFIKISKILIATQFWRTPCQKNLAIEYASKLLELYDHATPEIKDILGHDRKFIKFLKKRAPKEDAIKIIQFFLLPLISFDLSDGVGNFHYYIAPSDLGFLSSDRPVIYDNYDQLFSFKSLYFPLCKEILLVCSEKEIEKININSINNLITTKANEVIISASREQLEEIKRNSNSPK